VVLDHLHVLLAEAGFLIKGRVPLGAVEDRLVGAELGSGVEGRADDPVEGGGSFGSFRRKRRESA